MDKFFEIIFNWKIQKIKHKRIWGNAFPKLIGIQPFYLNMCFFNYIIWRCGIRGGRDSPCVCRAHIATGHIQVAGRPSP